MASPPHIIAVVSGKGGVGKTVFSANLAAIAATASPTVLVDLDFPNQGLSGLFVESIRGGCLSARDLIESTGPVVAQRICRLRDNLYFIPAFDPSDRNRLSFIQSIPRDLVDVLSDRINQVRSALSANLMVLDCHGGLDEPSFASFMISDRTFAVTEADAVTFNGTLELFDFYAENLERHGTAHCGSTSSSPQKTHHAITLVVNRMTGIYEYRATVDLYKRKLAENEPEFSSLVDSYQLIPTNQLLARSVSDYPLFVELLPESVFCQKLELICRTFLHLVPKIRGRAIFYRVFERKRPKSLERYTKSAEEVRMQAVFTFIAATQIGILTLIGASIAIAAYESAHGLDFAVGFAKSMITLIKEHPYAYAALDGIFGVFLMLTGRTNLLIAQHYRDRLRYDYRLAKKFARRTNMTLLAKIFRSSLARIYLDISGIILIILGVIYIILRTYANFGVRSYPLVELLRNSHY